METRPHVFLGREMLWLYGFLMFEENIKLLVDNGADPNISDEDGNTPLSKAAEKGYLDIVNILINYSGLLVD